ncbi:MAG: glycosyltransferase family 9 protein [Phycisphaerales bacterium]
MTRRPAQPGGAAPRPTRRKPARLLVVLPSWVGDAVMATPTLRVLREYLPGAFIGALARPGIDELLTGTSYFDELHVDRAMGVMGPKRVAGKVRPRRYETALLLTNSFSTALITRLSGIEDRIGYDRDGRGLLLTDRVPAMRRRDVVPFSRSETDPSAWAPVPACDYYYALAERLLASCGLTPGPMGPMELVVTEADELTARSVLADAGVPEGARRVVLNPGGNDTAKRWPAERYAALADYLAKHHGVRVLVNGAPGERGLVREIIDSCAESEKTHDLASAGVTLGALKAIVRDAALMVTNDTGPRHIAAAVGTPVITLFGPTDPRWTTIPFKDELVMRANPELPEEEVADDHPETCRIEQIKLGDVVAGANALLSGVSA